MTKTKADWLKQFGPEPQVNGFQKMTPLAATGLQAVRFMRWQAMTSKKNVSNIAGIIILNPDTFEPDLKYENFLVLRFWDHAKLDVIDHWIARVFGRNPELCVRMRSRIRRKRSAWPWRPPLIADAIAVRDFLANLPSDVKEIDVSCEYGRSRSRAVAEWIASENGIRAVGNREKGRANPRLAGLLNETASASV
jgi:hypothetical protein